jgi:hypothetical protein
VGGGDALNSPGLLGADSVDAMDVVGQRDASTEGASVRPCVRVCVCVGAWVRGCVGAWVRARVAWVRTRVPQLSASEGASSLISQL